MRADGVLLQPGVRERLLDSVFTVAADAIIAVDAELRIVLFNRGAEQIFGWASEEILGESLDRLLPVRFRAAHREHMRAFAEGPVAARSMADRGGGIFGLRKGGKEFAAQAAITKVLVGQSHFFNVVLRDVTEERNHVEEQKLLADVSAALLGVCPTVDEETAAADHDRRAAAPWIR
jgi:PAS domain S-box-containing protein